MCDHFKQSLGMLTGLEAKTVALLFEGMSAKEAARVLQCSHRTVEGHIGNIKLKLGVPKLSAQVLYQVLAANDKDWNIEGLGCSCHFCK